MAHSFVSLSRPRFAGDGERTLVLHHGFGTQQSVWDHLVPSLVAAGYRTLVFDVAGATRETLPLYHPDRHRSLLGFAEDLIALMQALNLRGTDFVGHSVGGIIGLLAANDEPGLFRSLTLIGSSACYIDDPDNGYIGGFTRQQIAGLIAAMREDYVTWANGFAPLVIGNAERPHLALEFTRSLLDLRPDIASAVLETIFLSDCRSNAQRSHLPALVLQTAHDPAVPQAAATWLANAMNAKYFKMIEAEGHFPHICAPEQVSQALLEFLASQVATPHGTA